MFKKILFPLNDLSKYSKIIFLLICDFIIISGTLFFTSIFFNNNYNFIEYIFFNFLIVFFFIFFKVYTYVIRYSDNNLVFKIFFSCLCSFIIILFYIYFSNKNYFFLLIFFQISIICLNCILLRKLYKYLKLNLLNFKNKKNLQPIFIYGAGDAGIKVAKIIKGIKYQSLVGFIDDDINLKNRIINNTQVFDYKNFENLIDNFFIKPKVILALPSIEKTKKIKILKKLNKLKVKTQSVPNLEDILLNNKINLIKDINFLDLISKDKLHLNQDTISKDIVGKSIFISGAGGSIGSNLALNIIKYKPRLIILFELNEYSLFKIESDLDNLNKNFNQNTEIISIIGSIEDISKLNQIFDKFNIDVIYNAAALKHVNLVEKNIIEGIKTNIIGTFNLYKISTEKKVKKFIHISTDKAVNPSNIMGLTKRFAEVLLMNQVSEILLSIVRFGNVMGSRGSVYEIFENQLNKGQNLTVTDTNAKRYFMSINDATQLVIQAGAMSKGKKIYALKMDEQIKIIDLATKMIELSGYNLKDNNNPDGDIEITITGLKEGEKIKEELYENQTLINTDHSLIYEFNENCKKDTNETDLVILKLIQSCEKYDIDLSLNLIKKYLGETNFKESIIDSLK